MTEGNLSKVFQKKKQLINKISIYKNIDSIIYREQEMMILI